MPIRCEIVSQDSPLYEGDVDIVVIPGVDGIMGILPNHAPLLTTLNFGVVQVRVGDTEENFTVAGGVAQHDRHPDAGPGCTAPGPGTEG